MKIVKLIEDIENHEKSSELSNMMERFLKIKIMKIYQNDEPTLTHDERLEIDVKKNNIMKVMMGMMKMMKIYETDGTNFKTVEHDARSFLASFEGVPTKM